MDDDEDFRGGAIRALVIVYMIAALLWVGVAIVRTVGEMIVGETDQQKEMTIEDY